MNINLLIYLLVSIGLISLVYFVWQLIQKIKSIKINFEDFSEDLIPKYQASTDYLISEAIWKKVNRKFFREINNYQTIAIPGLKGAWSLNLKNQQLTLGFDWVPQSITTTNKYMIVGAYDANHQLNSLLFIIDKKTGVYLKTIVLPSRSHLGGIAYDSKTNNLWFTNNYKNVSRLSVISQDSIEKYQFKKAKKPIAIDKNFDLPFIKAISSISIADNSIYILIFNQKKKSGVIGLPLVNGYIDLDRILKKKIDSNLIIEQLQQSGVADYISISRGFKRMQGVGIFENIAFFSSSYGRRNSELIWAKKNSADIGLIGDGGRFIFQKLATIKLPPYLEQIDLLPTENKLILLFESGAIKYRLKTTYLMDRIMIIDFDYQSINQFAKQFSVKPHQSKSLKYISSNFK